MNLESELKSVEAAIETEKKAERFGSTRFSRLPGLLAERDAILQLIERAKEPDDLALHIAKLVVAVSPMSVVNVARLIRHELGGKLK